MRNAYQPAAVKPSAHAVVRDKRTDGEWFCQARDPRCHFRTADPSAAIHHAVAGQYAMAPEPPPRDA